MRANRNCSTQLIKLITTCGIARTFSPRSEYCTVRASTFPVQDVLKINLLLYCKREPTKRAYFWGTSNVLRFLSSGSLICVSGRVFHDDSQDRSAFRTPGSSSPSDTAQHPTLRIITALTTSAVFKMCVILKFKNFTRIWS